MELNESQLAKQRRQQAAREAAAAEENAAVESKAQEMAHAHVQSQQRRVKEVRKAQRDADREQARRVGGVGQLCRLCRVARVDRVSSLGSDASAELGWRLTVHRDAFRYTII